ncbi:MAG: META domain-containing protein [Bacteroidota bacterium]
MQSYSTFSRLMAFLPLLAMSLSFYACPDAADQQSVLDVDKMVSQEWVLQTYEIEGTRRSAINKPSLQFVEDRAIIGHTGCNTMGGQYNLQGPRLMMGPLRMSKRFCADMAEQERAITLILGDTVTVELKEDQLHFYNDAGRLIYGISDGAVSQLQPDGGEVPDPAVSAPVLQSAQVVVEAESEVVEDAEEAADKEITGLFVYMADAAGFTPCGSSVSYPVSMEKGYMACESAYSGMEKFGEPALARVRGYTQANRNPEGRREVFVIEELIEMTVDISCP